MATETGVLVIGGGSTGCGVARDLARRGVETTLVEAGTLTHGTTGRMHGLLHSGARYAVSDQTSARECLAENRVLRDIASHCIEPTGGLFVKRPEDSADYFREKVDSCRECNIPVTILSGREARHREPALAADVERAIAVPDAAIDPFRLCVGNAADAQSHGARIETRTEVTEILQEGGAVVGAKVKRTPQPGADTAVTGSSETILADHIVNATGAWAGQIGTLAGLDIDVRPTKGVMTVLNSRPVDTVINRCRPKGDADILVPHETTAILGTTDEPVEDPTDFQEESWEVDLLFEELSKLVPGIEDDRTLRSYWGVRPLYEPDLASETNPNDVTRNHFVLDHEQRDGTPGITTVVGGKLTTYRLMAEEVSDLVCEKLGVTTASDTAAVPLPGSEDPDRLADAMEQFGLRSPVARRSKERLGSRAVEVLSESDPNPVLCDCEAVTRAEVRDAIADVGSDLNAVRIRTRASMGNCQGGRCGHRLAAELTPEFDALAAREALAALREERFRGQRHALWGRQLAQAMLNYFHSRTSMNEIQGPAQTDETVEWAVYDGGPDK